MIVVVLALLSVAAAVSGHLEVAIILVAAAIGFIEHGRFSN